jgi:hypothetical protein
MAGGRPPWYAPIRTRPLYEDASGWVTHGIPVPWSVLHSPDGEPWPDAYRERLLALLDEYGRFCVAADAIFPIRSAYRSSLIQHAHYRARASTHLRGYALDLTPVGPWTVRRMASLAQDVRASSGSVLCGIGIAPDWLHVDIRPRTRGLTWAYSPASAD